MNGNRSGARFRIQHWRSRASPQVILSLSPVILSLSPVILSLSPVILSGAKNLYPPNVWHSFQRPLATAGLVETLRYAQHDPMTRGGGER